MNIKLIFFHGRLSDALQTRSLADNLQALVRILPFVRWRHFICQSYLIININNKMTLICDKFAMINISEVASCKTKWLSVSLYSYLLYRYLLGRGNFCDIQNGAKEVRIPTK